MRRVILIYLILLLFIFSCVYYNTFYHAEQNYKKAEKSQKKANRELASGAEIKDYEEAIKKASKVLTFHPKSKWVDDALFLIGKSYFNLGEYAKAERKFQEIISNFPKSNLIEDSYYHLGMSRYKQGNELGAFEVLNSLLDNPKLKKRKSEVCFNLGEMRFGEGEYLEAITFYTRMLKDYPKGELNAVAQFRIGESYFKLKDFAQAKESFSSVKRYEKEGELAYKSLFWSGEAAYALKSYKEGQKIFFDLSREKKYSKYLPQIGLKIAEGYRLEDSLDLALKNYEGVSLTYPKTDESTEGYYRMGMIYLEGKRDLKKAQEYFDKAKTEKPNTPFARSALEKSADISKLTTYQEQVTKEEAEKAVEPLFHLAEFYLTQMNMPESALAEYQYILDQYPESEYVPKSLYAIAWIYENVLVDSAKARDYYQKITEKYPNSDYIERALIFLSLPEDSIQVNLAQKEYLLAESLLFKEENLDSAKTVLQKIVSDYPQSRYAGKAECALVWILENYSNPGDSSVALAYQAIIDKYPETEYADYARQKLGIKVTKAPPPPQETPSTPADTTQRDTTTAPQTPEIPKAPQPVEKGPFHYPESQIESGIKGKVVLKIQIDFDGKVRDAVILNSSGNMEIDEAVKQAALNTTFNPTQIDPLQLGKWFIYEIEVSPPQTQQQP